MEDLFCTKHIIGLIWVAVMVAALIIISKLASKKFGVKKVLQAASLVFLSLEAIKYIYLGKELDMYYFPLQFCSLMLYAYPVVAFGRGKVEKFVLPFAYACGLLAGAIALAIPTNILGAPDIGWLAGENFLYTLSFVYHGFMVYFSLFLVISGYYRPKYKEILSSLIIAVFFAALACIMNASLNMDYMMLNRGAGNPLVFILKTSRVLYYLAHVALFFTLCTILTFFTRLFTGKKPPIKNT
ncbi:MAG: YwaF family protein [Oscillospiraceae bacterium]|jgi:uncharacterized membrane protein YwaF|nr:YwaF family protein [Oscillospiraceae bacterium]